MNPTLKEALADENNSLAFYAQKTVLVSELKEKLVFYKFGGTFVISESLIAFVRTLTDRGHVANIPLLDSNDDPVMVPDLNAFLTELIDVYFQAMNEYVVSHTKLAKKRKVSKLIK
jgi:hypothetical protein